MSYISEYLRALIVQYWLSVCLCLPLLIKHKEKQQQREHRMRKEAGGQHKERTIKRMKENRFMCIQQCWCKRKNEKRTERQRWKEKIHSMINYPHCIPETHRGRRTVGTGQIHKDTDSHSHTLHNQAEPQRFMKVWAAVFVKVHLSPQKLQGQGQNNSKITANVSTEVDRLSVYRVIIYTLCVNTLTLHRLNLVIFQENKLDPLFIFD